MELILKTDDEASIARIIDLANELHVDVEKRGVLNRDTEELQELRKYLLNFKAPGPSSRENASEWQSEERKDRDLPFRD